MHAFFEPPPQQQQANGSFVPQQMQQQPWLQPMTFDMQPRPLMQQQHSNAFMQPQNSMQPIRPTLQQQPQQHQQQPAPPQLHPQYPMHAATVAWQPVQPAPAFPPHTMQTPPSSLVSGVPRSAATAPTQAHINSPAQSARPPQQTQPFHAQSQPQARPPQQLLATHPQQPQQPAQPMKGAQPAPLSNAIVTATAPQQQQPQQLQQPQPLPQKQQFAPSGNGHVAPMQLPAAQPLRPSQPQLQNSLSSPTSQQQPQHAPRPTQPIGVAPPASAAAPATNGPLHLQSSLQQPANGSAIISPPRLPQQQLTQPSQQQSSQFLPQPHVQAPTHAQPHVQPAQQPQLPSHLQARGIVSSPAAQPPVQNGHATAPVVQIQPPISISLAPAAAASSSLRPFASAPASAAQSTTAPTVPAVPRVVSDVRKHELLAKAHALYDEQQAHTRLMSQQLIDLRQQLVQTQSQLQQASLQSMMPTAPSFSSDPDVAPLTSSLSASPDPALLALFENSKALESKLAEKHHLVERMRGTIAQVERFVQEQVQKEQTQKQQEQERGTAMNGADASHVAAVAQQLSHRSRMLASMHDESASALNAPPVPDASMILSSPIVQTLLSHIAALQTQNSLTQSLLLLKNQSLSQQTEQHSTLVSHLREQISNLVAKGERREQENLEERGMLVDNLKRMIEELALENESLKKEKRMQTGSQASGSSPRSSGNQQAMQSSPRGSSPMLSGAAASDGFGLHSAPTPVTNAPVASSFAAPAPAAAAVPAPHASGSTSAAAPSIPAHFAPMPPFPHSPQRPAANGTTTGIVPPPFASPLSAAPFRPTALPTPQAHADAMLGPSPFKTRPSFLPPLPTN